MDEVRLSSTQHRQLVAWHRHLDSVALSAAAAKVAAETRSSSSSSTSGRAMFELDRALQLPPVMRRNKEVDTAESTLGVVRAATTGVEAGASAQTH